MAVGGGFGAVGGEFGSCGLGGYGGGGGGLGVSHLDVVGGVGGILLWGCAVVGGGGGVEKLGALGVAGYHGDLVGVVEGEVGVDEDEEVCYRFGEREGVGEESPGVRVRVEDYGQQRRGGFCFATGSAPLLCNEAVAVRVMDANCAYGGIPSEVLS